MATINFYLRPEMKDSNELSPIYLIYQDKGRKFKYYTGQKIPASTWDSTAQAVKEEALKAENINHILRKQKEKLETVLKQIKDNGNDLSIDNVRLHFHNFSHPHQKESEFYTLFEEFIAQSRSSKKPSTITIYQSVLKDIRKFDEVQDYPIDFSKINKDFYEAFTKFLIEKLNNTNNTVSKKIKTLKVFLRFASARNFIDYSSYYSFKTKTVSPVRVLLTNQELSNIFNLNLSLNKELQEARDIFLFGCFTGLKFSDIMKLKHEDVREGRLKILNHYTGKEITVPMNNYAQMILKRYEGKGSYSFPRLANVYANKYVKQIAKLAGLNETIEIKIHKGNDVFSVNKAKHELVTTDTARFTFASLSLQAGMRPELLILILGQKNINSLLQYIIDSNPMKDIEMINCWNKKVF